MRRIFKAPGVAGSVREEAAEPEGLDEAGGLEDSDAPAPDDSSGASMALNIQNAITTDPMMPKRLKSTRAKLR
jgi:hypothetical protein